jgi:nitroreductase
MTESMDTGALLHVIQTRRSIGLKSLSPDPIDLNDVQLMLDAARWVPNHGLSEPWRFTVFSGEGRRALGEAFAEAYRLHTPPEKFEEQAIRAQRERVWQAPVWISIGMAPGDKYPEWEDIMTMGAVVQNMQLVATQLGLGSRLSSGATSIHHHVAELVGLKPPARLLAFMYVGKPAGEWPKGVRKPIHEKVSWVNGAETQASPSLIEAE